MYSASIQRIGLFFSFLGRNFELKSDGKETITEFHDKKMLVNQQDGELKNSLHTKRQKAV